MKIDREAVFQKCCGLCAYCGCQISFKGFHVDHVHPKARAHMWPKTMPGGVDSLENLLPSCRKCNNYKGAMFLEDFRLLLSKQVERLQKRADFDRALRFGQVQLFESPIVFYFESLGVFVDKRLMDWRNVKHYERRGPQ